SLRDDPMRRIARSWRDRTCDTRSIAYAPRSVVAVDREPPRQNRGDELPGLDTWRSADRHRTDRVSAWAVVDVEIERVLAGQDEDVVVRDEESSTKAPERTGTSASARDCGVSGCP
ncbi:MAG: hypothetical protein K8E66_11135, partial [Phycisphaerales bacterium]|nr:hypothetical protein [Phycisphaerales bacterium]